MWTTSNPNTDSSSGSIAVLSGTGITLWSDPESVVETTAEVKLQVSPHQPIIIGRFDSNRCVPYLDPAYSPSTILPNSGQSVLQTNRPETNRCLSRAHFMLRWSPGGILFVNGVPRRGGGIRPPRNGTLLLSPSNRRLELGEEYFIERDQTIVIRLPNYSVVQIIAG